MSRKILSLLFKCDVTKQYKQILSLNVLPTLYFVDCVNCPVTIFELYLSKLDPRCNYLWQRPKQKVNYVDTTWFEARRIGHNPLETFMKQLSEEANLANKGYTNHSIRGTCIGKLDRSGFEARHITAISSHKSESTIREYSTKCPENKRKEMFNALAEDIIPPKIPKQDGQVLVPNQNTLNIAIPTTSDTPKLNLSDMDLLELDTTDDQLLVDILTQTEKNLNTTNDTSGTITNVQQNFNRQIPVIPKMYFPHSNVTINYNFGK